jgi:predicted aminopeptidase
LKRIPKPVLIITILCLLINTACTSFGYYVHSMSGQMQVLFKKKPLSELINDPDTDNVLREKLIHVQEILEFAHQSLFLPDNGSYRHYTDLNRQFVVWNVVAAPEFSLTPKQWCFLVVGCINYRGYFNAEDATQYANYLQKRGWEVHIGGVTAYSTLGWFRDPVISTMINREEWEIARLLFHELAHQLLYIKDDTEFNEAFADSVSLIGLQHWLQSQAPMKQQQVMELISHEDEFTQLALETRNALQNIYNSGASDDEMRGRKSELIGEMQVSLARLHSAWVNDDRYQSWAGGKINNARLSLVSTYRALVPHFLRLYQDSGTDFRNFYKQIKELSECSRHDRLTRLMGTTGRPGPC